MNGFGAIHSVIDLLTESSRNGIHAENAVSHLISCKNSCVVIAEKELHQKAGPGKHCSNSWFYLSAGAVVFQKSVTRIRNFPLLLFSDSTPCYFFSLVDLWILKVGRKRVRIVYRVLRTPPPQNATSTGD